jgi:hypothetical protein
MMRALPLLFVCLVLAALAAPLHADTVVTTYVTPGASYTYEYTWVLTPTPGGASTGALWISCNVGTNNSMVTSMITPPGWTYAGVGNHSEGWGLKWTGVGLAPNSYTFKVGSNVCPGGSATCGITGTGNPKSGTTQSPAPEAGTLLLFAAGLAPLGAWGARRRRAGK